MLDAEWQSQEKKRNLKNCTGNESEKVPSFKSNRAYSIYDDS